MATPINTDNLPTWTHYNPHWTLYDAFVENKSPDTWTHHNPHCTQTWHGQSTLWIMKHLALEHIIIIDSIRYGGYTINVIINKANTTQHNLNNHIHNIAHTRHFTNNGTDAGLMIPQQHRFEASAPVWDVLQLYTRCGVLPKLEGSVAV